MGGRFLRYLQSKGMKQRTLSSVTGVSASIISRFCAGGTITSDKLAQLLSGCPDLSLDWLFFGVGPMYRQEVSSDVVSGGSVLVKDADRVTVANGDADRSYMRIISERDAAITELTRSVNERDVTIQRLHDIIVRNAGGGVK